MDLKLQKIKDDKKNAQMQNMEKSLIQAKDEKSGILMRKNTRILTEDEIMAKVGSRDFVSIE